MIYFFHQFHLNTNNTIDNLSTDDYYVDIIKENWHQASIDIHQELVEKYDLPAFHLWGDGFSQGDASDDEVFEAKDNINAIDGTDEPAVYAEWSEEDDEILTDVFTYLDQQFISIAEEKLKEILEENKITEEQD